MNLQVDFSKAMLLRVILAEGRDDLLRTCDKRFFDGGIKWDHETMTTVRAGTTLNIGDQQYEVVGFELHSYKADDPESTTAGFDSVGVGETLPHNMALTINLQQI